MAVLKASGNLLVVLNKGMQQVKGRLVSEVLAEDNGVQAQRWPRAGAAT